VRSIRSRSERDQAALAHLDYKDAQFSWRERVIVLADPVRHCRKNATQRELDELGLGWRQGCRRALHADEEAENGARALRALQLYPPPVQLDQHLAVPDTPQRAGTARTIT
jgi:hypothetical protein